MPSDASKKAAAEWLHREATVEPYTGQKERLALLLDAHAAAEVERLHTQVRYLEGELYDGPRTSERDDVAAFLRNLADLDGPHAEYLRVLAKRIGEEHEHVGAAQRRRDRHTAPATRRGG